MSSAAGPAPATLDPQVVLTSHTHIASPPLTPELRFHLADPDAGLWREDEETLAAQGLPAPFWAFAWGGGQALARLLLDQPELAAGRRVLDFACGCGIAGIAAARTGAASVQASEIDAFAIAAARANAALNEVELQLHHGDLVGQDDGWELILAGDVFYENEAGARIADWLQLLHQRGAQVLIGDPGRAYLPKDRLVSVARFTALDTGPLDDQDVRAALIWRFADGPGESFTREGIGASSNHGSRPRRRPTAISSD